jgi:hypothetical protein
MAVRHVMAVIVNLQKIALHEHYAAMTMVFATMVAESSTSRRTRNIWMYDWSTVLRIDCYLDVTRSSYSNDIQGYFRKLLIICAVSYFHH